MPLGTVREASIVEVNKSELMRRRDPCVVLIIG